MGLNQNTLFPKVATGVDLTLPMFIFAAATARHLLALKYVLHFFCDPYYLQQTNPTTESVDEHLVSDG